MPGVPELSPTEFIERWPDHAQGAAVVLLDVREHAELEVAAVPAAVHIPMREVPARLAEFDRNAPLGNGFSQVFNLRGGIDAWSTEIDPQVPRY
jgi:rhodanese-related sulfurtransferase